MFQGWYSGETCRRLLDGESAQRPLPISSHYSEFPDRSGRLTIAVRINAVSNMAPFSVRAFQRQHGGFMTSQATLPLSQTPASGMTLL